MICSVIRVPMGSPGDLSELQHLIKEGVINTRDVVAVLGKTEGNGCVNDFTRGYAVSSLRNFFEASIADEAASKIIYVMSGGTEGILSPHFTVISKNGQAAEKTKNRGLYSGRRADKSLAIGIAKTEKILPEQLGRMEQVRIVAKAVRKAMLDAAIDDVSDIHFVQIKCPLLTAERIKEANSRNKSVVTEDTYKSMGYSRGASALGVAVAIGEIREDQLKEQDICHSWDLFSSVASTSAGIELTECEIVVLGNSEKASGDFFITHDVMNDAIDGEAVIRALAKAGWTGSGRPNNLQNVSSAKAESIELVQILAKAEADPTGYVRGRRHTMLEDSDINHTRHARAVVGGVIASIVGDPMVYVSGGAEHQGPPGGGPVAVICKRV